MITRVLRLAAIASLPACFAWAAADITAGAEKAKICAGCHGADGISATPGIPSLAGQQDQFIQWQLVFFRSGRHQNPLMVPLVAQLTDQDIRNLGAYFHSLPYNTKPSATTQDVGLASRGQTIVAQHGCTNCHGDDLRGNRAAAAIANQREDYLVKALTDYRSSARPSTGVAAMNEAASGLDDAQIAAVANYIAALEPPKK